MASATLRSFADKLGDATETVELVASLVFEWHYPLMLSAADLAAASNVNAPRGHRAMRDAFGRAIGAWTGAVEGPAMARAAARAAVEGSRLAWSKFVADEGDYPTYPAPVVFAWIRASVY